MIGRGLAARRSLDQRDQLDALGLASRVWGKRDGQCWTAVLQQRSRPSVRTGDRRTDGIPNSTKSPPG